MKKTKVDTSLHDYRDIELPPTELPSIIPAVLGFIAIMAIIYIPV